VRQEDTPMPHLIFQTKFPLHEQVIDVFSDFQRAWRSLALSPPASSFPSFLFQSSSSLSRLLASGESPRLLRMTTESAHSLHREKEDEHDSADAAGGHALACASRCTVLLGYPVLKSVPG
jgi:hypothetical protein